MASGRITLFVGGGLLAVTALAALVGYCAARPETGNFDWELASIFGTALGTSGLAGFTGALAYVTRQDQIEREKPVVLLMNAEWNGNIQEPGQSGTLWVNVRNVGLGPALHVVVRARYEDEAVGAGEVVGEVSALAPNEEED